MVQSNPSPSNQTEMVTNLEDIVRQNSTSAWMSSIESEDPDSVRQLLLQKLGALSPEQASPITGPRNDNDVSYQIWERVKSADPLHDYEVPKNLSRMRFSYGATAIKDQFNALDKCTDTQV